MTEQPKVRSVQELAAMEEQERVAYFLAHPLEGTDQADAEFLARHRASSVLTIAARDAQQAGTRGGRRAS